MDSEFELILSGLEHDQSWASREFSSVKLGDPRRTRRLVSSVGTMIDHPGLSIPDATDRWGDAKAFYSLLARSEVTSDVLLKAHHDSTLRRASESSDKFVLAVQDTTTLNFSSHEDLDGLGPIGNSDNFRGLFVHNTLLIGGDNGEIFGLLGAKIYARDGSKRRSQTPGTRNRESIEEKESYRWLESFEMSRKARKHLCSVAAKEGGEAPVVVNVGDREGDIYELLLEARKHREEGAALLVRCQHNREIKLEPDEQDEDGEVPTRVWERLAQAPCQGMVEVELPRRGSFKRRKVDLEVRFLSVELEAPRHKQKYLGATESVKVAVIEIKEPGVEGGVHWRLLTTLAVTDFETACRVVRWYSLRWQVEVFHRVLKTGCRVERRQMRTMASLEPMIALDLIVAAYLTGLISQSRSRPQAPASEWLESAELQALVRYHREDPAKAAVLTVGEATALIGRLGGHLGRKNDGPPGAEVVWRGLRKLQTITEAWLLFTEHQNSG